jgi:hypothetical protein
MTCTTNASKSNSASSAFLEPPGTRATRPRTVRHVSIAASGSQANFSSVQGGLLLAKAAPEPNTYRRNLRGRGSHGLAPIGLNHAGERIPSTAPRNTGCDRTHCFDCEKRSTTTVLAVCLVQAGSGHGGFEDA